jgi:hypothetical protein
MKLLLFALLIYGFTSSNPITVWVGPPEPQDPHAPVDRTPVTFQARAEWGEVTASCRALYNQPLPKVRVHLVARIIGGGRTGGRRFWDVDDGSGRTVRVWQEVPVSAWSGAWGVFSGTVPAAGRMELVDVRFFNRGAVE